MFENFKDDNIKFEFESEDGAFYCDSVTEFNMATKMMPIEEVGISFNGEIKIDEQTSVITDKKIKLENTEVAAKTYKKVMEMRELTEVERNNISKVKLALKKLFEVFFRGDKWRRNICIFWAITLALDIAAEKYFAAILMAACIVINTSSIKFSRELKKLFGNKKHKKELIEELSNLKILYHVNSVDDAEDIKLYFKPKPSGM